jgi:hypothetical protein
MVLWSFVELSFKGPYTQPSAYLQQCSVCDPAKKLSHPNLVVYIFPTPPIKLKLGQQTAGRLQIKPPGPMIFRNTEQQSDHIYYTHFCRCTTTLRIFTSHPELFKSKEPKPFPELNWHVFTFFHLILLCRSQTDHCWRWSSAPIFPFEKERTTQHWYDELGVLVTLSWMRLLSLGAGCGGAGLGFMTQLMMHHNWKPRWNLGELFSKSSCVPLTLPR